ncbi:MAG: metallophosphoesterase [Planctomycetota bacterium]
MATYFFASDLHGHSHRYHKLFAAIAAEKPAAVFLGGDLLPSGLSALQSLNVAHRDFVSDFLVEHLRKLSESLKEAYPRVFVILGNDDSRSEEATILAAAAHGVWEYAHERHTSLGEYDVYGYACVPPTPFLLKDWERYDVSRHVDPGCVSPEDGHRSVPAAANEIRYATIQEDLRRLVGDADLAHAVMLFHAPPYKTNLDRAALDGKMVDHVPLDLHVGSIAIQRFIEERQPLITLHGHIHESARLTGSWSQRIGRTYCFSAAHDGPELALVRFDPADPASATRTLI